MRKILFIFIFLFVLNIVSAYDTNNIIAYYSFNSTGRNITASTGQNLIAITSQNGTVAVGKVNNSILFNHVNQTYSANLTQLKTVNNFSINFWTYINASSSAYFNIGNTSVGWYFRHLTGNNLWIGKGVASDSAISIPATSGWNMITLNFVNHTAIYVYINGTLADTVTASDLENFPTNLSYITVATFDASYITLLDEMIIFNTTLELIDMNLLYNAGTGLDYSHVVTSQSTNPPYCLGTYIGGSSTLCTAPIFSYIDGQIDYGSVACYEDDAVACISACTNTLVNGSYVGACDEPSNCTISTGSCVFLFDTECSSLTTVRTCDYHGTLCPTWSNPVNCGAGSVCIDGDCTFVNSTALGTLPYYDFGITPYIINSNDTTYNHNAETRNVDVFTKKLFHQQDFSYNSVAPSMYIATVCDYKESLYDSKQLSLVNSSNTTTFSPFSDNARIEFRMIYNSLNNINISNTTIHLSNLLNGKLLNTTLERNNIAKTLCIYDNQVLLTCDTSSNSYDDLLSVDIEYMIGISSDIYSVKYKVNRVSNNDTYYQNIQELTTNTDIAGIKYTTPLNISYETKVYKFNALAGFNQVTNNAFGVQKCIFTQTKCYLTRHYFMSSDTGNYNNYKDYNICVKTLGASSVPAPDTSQSFIDRIPLVWRYIIMMIVVFVFLLIPMIFSGPDGVLAGLAISAVVCIAFSIIFKLTAIIPIVYSIIASAIIAVMMKKVAT